MASKTKGPVILNDPEKKILQNLESYLKTKRKNNLKKIINAKISTISTLSSSVISKVKSTFPHLEIFILDILKEFAEINDWLQNLKLYCPYDFKMNSKSHNLEKVDYVKISFDPILIQEEMYDALNRTYSKEVEENFRRTYSKDKNPDSDLTLPVYSNQAKSAIYHLIHIITTSTDGSNIKPFFKGDKSFILKNDYLDYYNGKNHHGQAFDNNKPNKNLETYQPSLEKKIQNTLCYGSPQCGKSGTVLFQIFNNYIYNYVYRECFFPDGEAKPIFPWPELPASPKDIRDNFKKEWTWFKEVYGDLVLRVGYWNNVSGEIEAHSIKLADLVKHSDKSLEDDLTETRNELSQVNLAKAIPNALPCIAGCLYTTNPTVHSCDCRIKYREVALKKIEVDDVSFNSNQKFEEMVQNLKKIIAIADYTKNSTTKDWYDPLLALVMMSGWTINLHWDEAHHGTGKPTDTVKTMSGRSKTLLRIGAGLPNSTNFLSGITATPTMYLDQDKHHVYSFFRYPEKMYSGLPFLRESLHHNPSLVLTPALMDFYEFCHDIQKIHGYSDLQYLPDISASLMLLDPSEFQLAIQDHKDLATLKANKTANFSSLSITDKRKLLIKIEEKLKSKKMPPYFHEIAWSISRTSIPYTGSSHDGSVELRRDLSKYSNHSDYIDKTIKALALAPFAWFENQGSFSKCVADDTTPRKCGNIANFCVLRFLDQTDEVKLKKSPKATKSLYRKLQTALENNALHFNSLSSKNKYRIEDYTQKKSSQTFDKWLNNIIKPKDDEHLIVMVKQGLNMAVRLDKRFVLGIDVTSYETNNPTCDSIIQGISGRLSGLDKNQATIVSSECCNLFLSGLNINKGKIKLCGKNHSVLSSVQTTNWHPVNFFELLNFFNIEGKTNSKYNWLSTGLLIWANTIKNTRFVPGPKNKFNLPNSGWSNYWYKVFEDKIILNKIGKHFNFPLPILNIGTIVGSHSYQHWLQTACEINSSKHKPAIDLFLKNYLTLPRLIKKVTQFYDEYELQPPADIDFKHHWCDNLITAARNSWNLRCLEDEFWRVESRPAYPWIKASAHPEYLVKNLGFTNGYFFPSSPKVTGNISSENEISFCYEDRFFQKNQIPDVTNWLKKIRELPKGSCNSRTDGFVWPITIHFPLDVSNKISPSSPTIVSQGNFTAPGILQGKPNSNKEA